MPGLTPKQQRFVAEYLVDLNATQAAIRAGYSERTAKQQASRLLSNVDISEAIEIAQREHSQNSGVTVERVVRELASLAFNDPTQVMSPDGHLLPLTEWPATARAAISKIKVRRETRAERDPDEEPAEILEIGFWDKNRALDGLSKHLGLYAADNRQKGLSEPLADLLREGRSRVASN